MTVQEFESKKADTERLLEALVKLDAAQVKAYSDMIIGTAALNQLMERDATMAANKPLTA